jgi:Escherichia/Staphylococcus phage prohead protease
MSNETERRINKSNITIRSQADGKKYVEGYAATYKTRSKPVQGMFVENLCAGCTRCTGAFSRAIRERQDVKLLFNHNADQLPLARTASGTLVLSNDATGLRFSALLPDSQFAKDLASSLQRRDLDSCSFAFVKRDDTWTDSDPDAEDEDSRALPLRTVHDLDLFDVSIVNFPQYPGTSVSSVDPGATVPHMEGVSIPLSVLAEARSRGGKFAGESHADWVRRQKARLVGQQISWEEKENVR